jgi:arylsulfatase A-like enzyme
MIHSIDEGVGRITAVLEELDLDDNTLVIFYSDNGPHQRFSAAQPLREGKGTLYEGGVRVPLIVCWPSVAEPGSVCDEPVQHVDFYPTFLEITGADAPGDHPLDGHSFVPLLRSGGQARLDREAIFWHFPGYLEGYLPGQRWRTTPVSALRARDWKLLEYFDDGRVELYNLAEDLGEQNDFADTLPDKRDQLHAKLTTWRQDIGAQLPEPR